MHLEILATVEYKGFYISLLIVLSLATLFFLAVSAYGVFDNIKSGTDFSGIAALIICIGLTMVCGYGTYDAYTDGVPVEYKAKITDFNEVYNKGYEIIDQEGKIYTLEKK